VGNIRERFVPLIFVDANVYLDSYRRVSAAYRDLLKSLISLGNTLFVPKTVVNEVERNRVIAYSATNKVEITNAGFGSFDIAPHYSDDTAVVEKIKTDL
jgi:hypothetical protein